MKTEPNWDEAPSEATLFCTNLFTVSPWFKTEDGKLYNFYDGEKQWFAMGKVEDRLSTYEFTERPAITQQATAPAITQELTPEKAVSSEMEPTTWNGQGLPPVDCDHEFSANGVHWGERTILFKDDISFLTASKKFPASRWHYKVNDLDLKFRPLRNERDRWVEAAQTYFNKEHGEVCPSELALIGIYDALKSGALKAPKAEL